MATYLPSLTAWTGANNTLTQWLSELTTSDVRERIASSKSLISFGRSHRVGVESLAPWRVLRGGKLRFFPTLPLKFLGATEESEISPIIACPRSRRNLATSREKSESQRLNGSLRLLLRRETRGKLESENDLS